MVRRVGFGNTGDGDRNTTLKPPSAGERTPEGVTGEAATGEGVAGVPPPVVPAEPWVRFAVAGFIGLWLALWTWGIWYVFGQIAGEWDLWGGEDFDWLGFGFLAIWLFFALIGWAFGTVILIVMLFGKPVTPERRAERQARRAERRARREARKR